MVMADLAVWIQARVAFGICSWSSNSGFRDGHCLSIDLGRPLMLAVSSFTFYTIGANSKFYSTRLPWFLIFC